MMCRAEAAHTVRSCAFLTASVWNNIYICNAVMNIFALADLIIVYMGVMCYKSKNKKSFYYLGIKNIVNLWNVQFHFCKQYTTVPNAVSCLLCLNIK